MAIIAKFKIRDVYTQKVTGNGILNIESDHSKESEIYVDGRLTIITNDPATNYNPGDVIQITIEKL